MDIKEERSHRFHNWAKMQYTSPYVEISGDNYEFDPNMDPILCDEVNSINSFLAEAEIVNPIVPNGPLQSTTDAHEKMRKKLIYYFMNPIEKWHAKRRFPWKLCLQVIKIVFVTVQLILFGLRSYEYVQQHQDMTTALSRIFLKDWAMEVVVYPPSSGPYAVYTVPDFYSNINHVVKQFSKITTLAIGPYAYDNIDNTLTSMEFCFQFYGGHIFPSNSSISITERSKERCIKIPPLYPSGNPSWDQFSLEKFLHQFNITLNFKTLIDAKLHFSLRTLFLKSLSKLDSPECYHLKLHVMYDNSQHDGQVPITLEIKSQKVLCHIETKIGNEQENASYALRQFLNSSVLILCVLSAILCLRSLSSGYKLGSETVNFFHRYFRKQLSLWELIDFIDFWYVMIIISDILLIFGSIIKIQIEERSAEGGEYSKCSILLGVGNLLIWVGLLRYLGFFAKYNMLILTLKRAMPNVLRFILCAVFLYLGFCFCGWIVFAPYHIKFRSLSRTSECLFAIMNGDDMFATFALVNTNNTLIWWFSRLYLYTFLVLFIYVVISLFISVIMDTFDTIKSIYIHGTPPKTTIELFMAAKSYTVITSNIYIPEETAETYGIFKRFYNWLKLCCKFNN